MVSWEGLRELFRNCFTSDVSENVGAGHAYGRYFERAGEFYDFRGDSMVSSVFSRIGA